MTWALTDKCPHCGHRAAIHSGPDAQSSTVGRCHELPAASPCTCPGWHPEMDGDA